MRAYVEIPYTDDSGTYAKGQSVDFPDDVVTRLVGNGILTLEGPPTPPEPEERSWPTEPEPEPEPVAAPAKKVAKKTTRKKT